MEIQLCLFEDDRYANFKPLTLTRPVDDLRLGIMTIGQKWKQALGLQTFTRTLRSHLKDVFEAENLQPDRPCMWINSRYLPSETLLERLQELNEGQCLRCEGTVVAAVAGGEQSRRWQQDGVPDFGSLFVLETGEFNAITHLWDIFLKNGTEISRDIELLNPPNNARASVPDQATMVYEDRIFIEEGATIEPGCVLNAEAGPIYIGKGATVMAGSFLRGPIAVCEDATIKMGSRIYKNTTIGPVCKVGGEVNNSIFHSYSNKPHDGYIGNSLVGQWCNFGADSNVSNLKNNYSNIRITNWANHKVIDTGQQFFGSVLGDHTKTAINTQLNTGTLCGVCCNIFSTEFPPKFIPSFSWVGSNVIQTYKLEKAFRDMKAMMSRRDVAMASGYKQMLRHVFENRNRG